MGNLKADEGGGDREADASGPKTTRPAATSRRSSDMASPIEQSAASPVEREAARSFDAVPDRVDIRDWFYRPGLAPIPDLVCNCDRVPQILDQGSEGACTGFALAAVINFLLRERNSGVTVSPQMLYEMARRYDDWPGEDYVGSSARGAMKGWMRHGVCTDVLWPLTLKGAENFDQFKADEARMTPGGAFYRLMHRQIRDVHAAIAEVGAVYMTLMVHDGWDDPSGEAREIVYFEGQSQRHRKLPVIVRQDRAKAAHAVAIVGYTEDGFIIQNSWGEEWGNDGFALLPYEDYMLHAIDLWVAQLGVPIKADLWSLGEAYADTNAGIQRASAIVPLADIRPYAIDIGNNGELSRTGDYWTSEEDLARLFDTEIPKRTAEWPVKRVMLYLHGGLNDERSAARRVIAFRDVFLANQIYPLHIMWESGGVDAIKQMFADLSSQGDDRAGRQWLGRVRDGLLDARDWTLELTAALPGGALWREMKENAFLASNHPRDRGGVQILAVKAGQALKSLPDDQRDNWQLHIVGHSAGAIYAAHALEPLASAGIAVMSLQLMAPAITTDLFRKTIGKMAASGTCPLPDIYMMSDTGERDDDVGPYGKSLLYLISNAFEGKRETPLLGMSRFLRDRQEDRNAAVVDRELEALLAGQLIVAGESAGRLGLLSRSDSHGGFDNDPDTMNSVLRRILGAAPKVEFEARHLQY